MTEMAPGLCALVGIGLVTMWRDYRSGNWRGWLLPIALVITGGWQISILTSYPMWSRWLSPLIILITMLVALALTLPRLRSRRNLREICLRLASNAVIPGLFGLLLAPALWAGYSVIQNTASPYPTAGPTPQNAVALFGSNSQANFGHAMESSSSVPTLVNLVLIAYLEAHQGTTTFLVATPDAGTADAIILATNKPVMAMGGFSGNDPILSISDLQNLIRKNRVRFFLIDVVRTAGESNDLSVGPSSGLWQITLFPWISTHCRAVPASDWTLSPTAGTSDSQLYDCAARA